MTWSKVTIKFTSLTNLWSFRSSIAVNVFEMNLSEISITCDCTPDDIQLAVEKFHGRVLHEKKEVI